MQGDDSFAALIRSMEDGGFVDDAGVEVRNTIAALRKRAADTNTRAKGEITIKIKLVHDPKNILETEGSITTKLPKAARRASIHWTDEEGDILNRKPEKQLELTGIKGGGAPMNEAAKPAADPRPQAVKAL